MVVIAAALAVVIAPLAGVGVGRAAQSAGASVGRLLLVTLVIVAASAVFTLAGMWFGGSPRIPALSLRGLLVSHATLGAAALALGMFGVSCAGLFRDPLDAAGSSAAIALVIGFGVLVAGPPAGDLPTPLLNAALLASPVVATASAAGIDILRGDLLYELSPIAHRRFEYPDWYTAVALYTAIALALVAVSFVRRRDRTASNHSHLINGDKMTQVTVCSLCALLLLPSPGAAQNPTPRGGQAAVGTLSSATRQKLMESLRRAAAYLRSQEKADGTWENHPGITGMAATALIRQPGVPRDQQLQAVDKTLAYLRRLAKPDGGIYERDIPHYITAISVMLFVAAGQPQDKPLIEKGRQYLADHLLDEGEGVTPTDKFYGGLGYGGTSDGGRADIISLEYGLRAMKDAGVAVDSDAWKKAIVFLQRAQNNSETNDQGWASNDGGFVYYPGFSLAGQTRSYGSATYAGLMSYSWASLKKTDPRVQSVLKWVRDNYTVDENPGLGQKTVYYYYMVFAKALQAVGESVVVDARGQRHNWREDLGRKLLTLQHPEGYWVNTEKDEMQDNKVLVTAFTMMAIEAVIQ